MEDLFHAVSKVVSVLITVVAVFHAILLVMWTLMGLSDMLVELLFEVFELLLTVIFSVEHLL